MIRPQSTENEVERLPAVRDGEEPSAQAECAVGTRSPAWKAASVKSGKYDTSRRNRTLETGENLFRTEKATLCARDKEEVSMLRWLDTYAPVLDRRHTAFSKQDLWATSLQSRQCPYT